jgi:tetratricopeptide (TPR) repeat protein
MNIRLVLVPVLLLGLGSLAAPASTIRVACGDDAAGAEVSVDGKFKGECPVDIQVKEGQVRITAVKKDVGDSLKFAQTIKIGADVVKRVEVSFGGQGQGSASAPGAVAPANDFAVLAERYQAELSAYKQSIQACLPKYAIELQRLTSEARAGFREKYQQCRRAFAPEIPGFMESSGYSAETLYAMQCGSGDMDDGPVRSEPSEGEKALNTFTFAQDAQSWCARQFTKPVTDGMDQILMNDQDRCYHSPTDSKSRATACAGVVGDYDQLVRITPSIDNLSSRCLFRAMMGQLQAALADCNEAARGIPNIRDVDASKKFPNLGQAWEVLIHRGVAYLKLKQADDAFADFEAAFEMMDATTISTYRSVSSYSAVPLFGRGLAKQMRGDSGGADADLAAARKYFSAVAAEFQEYGLSTP